MTHASVSRRVAAAEGWAGAKLFERHGRGVRPTIEGERLLARLDSLLDAIGHLVDRERSGQVRETVKIATTPSFAQLRLWPNLKTLEGDDLRIEIIASVQNADLTQHDIDLVIRYGRGNWRIGRETQLPRKPLVPVVHRDLCLEPPKEATTVLELPLIHNSDKALWRSWQNAHGLERRPQAHDRVASGYLESLAAATAGLGAALFDPALHPLNDLAEDLLPLQQITLEEPPLGYWAIIPRGALEGASLIVERLNG